MRFEHVDLRKHDEHGTLHAKMPPKSSAVTNCVWLKSVPALNRGGSQC